MLHNSCKRRKLTKTLFDTSLSRRQGAALACLKTWTWGRRRQRHVLLHRDLACELHLSSALLNRKWACRDSALSVDMKQRVARSVSAGSQTPWASWRSIGGRCDWGVCFHGVKHLQIKATVAISTSLCALVKRFTSARERTQKHVQEHVCVQHRNMWWWWWRGAGHLQV